MTEKRLIFPPHLNLKKDKWNNLTVESARDVLNELVELGYGDFKLLIGYDSNLVYTGFTDKIYIVNKRYEKKILVKE